MSGACSLAVPTDYEAFLASKGRLAQPIGFECEPSEAYLFPFQRDLVRWSVRRGRAALFADTGLGKSRMQIEWARLVSAHTGGNVLILAPLAVAAQSVREAANIGVTVTLCRDGADVRPGINITNYDRLHRFDPTRFAAVVLDESSCIKHHDTKTLAQLMAAFAGTHYRLCATATPAPNDFAELGTHAEFLGVCTRQEMLSEYFVHDSGDTQTWRLKGHARDAFWSWVASWGALVRRPSDLGYDDAGYALPPLHIEHRRIAVDTKTLRNMGVLFAEEARSLTERRDARKASAEARIAMCAELISSQPDEQWLVWGDFNAETEGVTRAVPGAVEVRGPDDPESKESSMLAFADGGIRVLVTKPSIAGFGLNWQRCARIIFVGVSDSYESFYQAIRRCWRFGQVRPVKVYVLASEAEGAVVDNLHRKELDAQRMAEDLSAQTKGAVSAAVRDSRARHNHYIPSRAIALPAWMRSNP